MPAKLWKGTKRIGDVAVAGGWVLEVHRCGECGVVFAIEETYMDERREDHKDWLCPNGHSFYFGGESEKERLRRELREEQRRLENERARAGRLAAENDQLYASNRTLKGHVTRKKRELARTGAGVCPVDGCRRHFENLGRHMKTKHPDFNG